MRSEERLAEANLALEGLSVGDAFGERFFGDPGSVQRRLLARELPPAVWRWTDDTAMALGVVEVLRDRGHVDPDHLAHVFARNYIADPRRGYGRGAHEVLGAIAAGQSWAIASRALFGGTGSYGNGGAMRAAPVGGYFCDDLGRAVDAAVASAVPTHAHPEGVAGAVAVAVAAALLASGRRSNARIEGKELLRAVTSHVPDGTVRSGIQRALAIGPTLSPEEAGQLLGSGADVSAADTVPFCLWVVAWHQSSFAEALWGTVAALGDRDTTCAIVGGIVALAVGPSGIPREWVRAREPLAI